MKQAFTDRRITKCVTCVKLSLGLLVYKHLCLYLWYGVWILVYRWFIQLRKFLHHWLLLANYFGLKPDTHYEFWIIIHHSGTMRKLKKLVKDFLFSCFFLSMMFFFYKYISFHIRSSTFIHLFADTIASITNLYNRKIH